MKRLLPFLFILAIVGAAVLQTGNVQAERLANQVAGTCTSTQVQPFLYDQPGFSVSQFAWQATPPAAPIEEREHISWWWWVIGVVLVLAGGMLLYVLMKKDPRKDAR